MSAVQGSSAILLRLMHRHGQAADGVLHIPETGCGLAEALELGGERLNVAQWRAASQCRIARDGKGWQLVNGSETMVCTVNGERILRLHASPLAVGDAVELGLLHFEVACEPGAPTPVPPVGPQAIGIAIVDADADAFDLRNLAVQEEGTNRARNDDPFGVLDIAGAEARPMTDSLAECLGEAVTPPSSATRALAVTHDAPERSAEGPAATSVTLLMEGLHAEYVRVVQDPAQLAGRADWEHLLAADGEPAPTLGDLRKEALPYSLLGDILRPRESIDQLLAGFAHLGPDTFFAGGDSADVLHLFAADLARSARTALPSLTRREHHDVSPDSHMRLGATRPADKDTP